MWKAQVDRERVNFWKAEAEVVCTVFCVDRWQWNPEVDKAVSLFGA